MNKKTERISAFIKSLENADLPGDCIVLGGAKRNDDSITAAQNGGSCINDDSASCKKSTNKGDCVNYSGMCTESKNEGSCNNAFKLNPLPPGGGVNYTLNCNCT